MSFKLTQLLLALFPVEKATAYIALPSRQVRRAIAERLISGEIVVGKTDYWWSNSRRYTGSLENNILCLEGPFGHKKWCLTTQVQIVEDSGGTVLKFFLRLSTLHLLLAVSGLAFYVGFSLFILEFWAFKYIFFQFLFMYGVILAVFHYEAELIKEMIKRWVAEG